VSEGADRRPATHAVHAGERQRPPHEPVASPIYQTAPFRFDSAAELTAAFAGSDRAGLYSRYANPTVRIVEEKLAALEGAQDAVAFASGMAAISATLTTLLASGDRLLAARDLYGGTASWLDWLERHHPEIAVERVPLVELPERLEAGAAPGTRVVYLESPTNPLLACADIARLARACREQDLTLAVDNTFATPILQRPLALGAHVVVHSATKFLGGHSDLTAGIVAGDAPTMAAVRETMRLGGGSLDPLAAFLLARGMRTLALRVERQSANAQRLADLLLADPAVERVHYPGFDEIGHRQMSAGGGMLAFAVRGGWEAASRLLDRLRLFTIIPSLGGVESGITSPAVTSHRELPAPEREAAGIGDGLLRVSVGIEDVADLEADLEQALAGL
jgi:cystathionine beta-lyase/cystathionine gamma-synthase